MTMKPVSPTEALFLTPLLAQEGLEEIMASNRRLNAVSSLLEAVQESLAVLADLVTETGNCLHRLAEPELQAEARAAETARHEAARRRVLGLLTACWHHRRALLHLAPEGEPSSLEALSLLDGTAVLLLATAPESAAMAAEAMQPGGRHAALVQALTRARAALDKDRGALHEQLLESQARLSSWEAEAGMMEDTDLSKEAARLRALQIRQQLQGRALGIAAYTPRCLQDIPPPRR